MSIVRELIKTAEDFIEGKDLKIEDLRIGVFYTAAKLSSGQAGVAFTPRDLEDTVCCPRSAAKMPASGKLKGKKVEEFLSYAISDNSLKRSVGIALLNAVSAQMIREKGVQGGRIIKGADALDVVEFKRGDTVAMVGAFIPFIKDLKGKAEEIYIVDKHPQALKEEERHMWRSPSVIGEVMPQADVAIITGSALVEGGLDEILALCSHAREVVLAGPTASAWPEPFFKRGVTVMGGISISNADKLLQVVSEGGSGYFFTGPARKIAIVREKVLAV